MATWNFGSMSASQSSLLRAIALFLWNCNISRKCCTSLASKLLSFLDLNASGIDEATSSAALSAGSPPPMDAPPGLAGVPADKSCLPMPTPMGVLLAPVMLLEGLGTLESGTVVVLRALFPGYVLDVCAALLLCGCDES